MAINLLPTPPQPTIDLSASNQTVSEVGAEKQTQRASYATRGTIPPQQIRDSILLGYEDILREQVYYTQALEDRQNKIATISEVSNTAAAEGRGLSDEEIQYVTELAASAPGFSPKTVLETMYAKRFNEDLIKEDQEFAELEAVAPETAKQVFNATEDFMTKQQIAMKILEEQQERFERAGFGAQALSFAGLLVPGMSWLRQQDRISGSNNEGAFFSGSNIESQLQSLYLMNPEDFEGNLREAIESLSQENLFDALNFAQAAVSFSSSEAAWENIFGVVDAFDIATLGGGLALRSVLKSRKAVRAAAAGTSIARQVSQGDIAGAANTAVVQRIKDGLISPLASEAVQTGATRVQKQLDEVIQAIPGMFDPNAFFRNAGSLTSARQTRLMAELSKSQELLLDTLDSVTHVQRVTSETAYDQMIKTAEETFRSTNHRLDQSIVDIVPVNESADIFGGVDHIKILIGTKEANSFSSLENAENFATNVYRLPKGSYEVENFQGNWFLTMTQNVNETDLQVQLKRLTTENLAPESLVNRWLWGLRSADDVVSREANIWRKTATFGSNAVIGKMQEALKNLGSLGKNETRRLSEVMDDALHMTRPIKQPDGSIKDVSGVYYQTVGDFEAAYLSKHNLMPSFEETAAYFEFRQLMDWMHLMTNLSVYRDKARLGVQQYSVNVATAIEGTKEFAPGSSKFFEGRVVQELPPTYSIGWVSPSGAPKFSLSSRMFASQKEELTELLASGDYKLIQVVNPDDKDIRDLFRAKGEGVQFILAKDTQQKPLSSLQVPYNQGGHQVYSETAPFIKQAKVRQGQGRKVYSGDTTFYTSQSFKVLEGMAEKMNIARQMYRAKDPGFDAYVTKNLPFRSGKELAERFSDGTFSVDTPFVVTQHGQSARDVSKLEDLFDQPVVDLGNDPSSLSSKLTNQWTQERSERLLNVDTMGTQRNPAYKLSLAPTIDPMRALSVAGTQMARGRFMDDFKHRSIEDWVAQFSDVLDMPRAEALANPMKALTEAPFRETRDHVKLAAAKANRRAILTLLGQETDANKAWRWVRQKTMDQIYNRLGKKAATVLEPHLWNKATDPVTIMRSAVFHTKLGMFNPAQLYLQAATATMAMAIDGSLVRSAKAPTAYLTLRYMKMAEASGRGQQALAKAAASSLGVNPEDMQDMYRAWKGSGFDIIEGEYGPLDDYLNSANFLSKNGAQRALNAGTFFFKEGNNAHKGTSFVLSFLRWRDMNPKKALTNKDISEIVNRADLYYLNMSRASNAPWQSGGKWWQGATSVVSQFFAFQARLSETLLGDRLTGLEKLRLLGVNGLLWGIPVGVGGSVAGAFWPVGESVSEYVISNNIDTDANVFTRVAMDGILDMMVEHVVGQDMDVSERFGPGGLSWAKDFTEGNFAEVFGAAPNFLSSSMAALEPFWMASTSAIFGGPRYNLSQDDFIAALREISSVNRFVLALAAFTAGDWVNKKDAVVGENIVEKGDAAVAIAIALGLTPQDITDMYIKYQDNSAVAEAKRHITDLALREFSRGVKAAQNGDFELMDHFYKNANALLESGGLTPLERSNVWSRAMQDNGTMMERVERDYLMNDPENRMDNYLTSWEKRNNWGY